MFDNLKCLHPLPLTPDLLDNLENVNWADIVFQTKSLERSLSLYYITKEGLLFEEVVEREFVLYTEEEKQNINPKPWSNVKDIVEKNKHQKQINYHGIINFYNLFCYKFSHNKKDNVWIEFNAYFIHGKLDKIDLVKTTLIENSSFSANKI